MEYSIFVLLFREDFLCYTFKSSIYNAKSYMQYISLILTGISVYLRICACSLHIRMGLVFHDLPKSRVLCLCGGGPFYNTMWCSVDIVCRCLDTHLVI